MGIFPLSLNIGILSAGLNPVGDTAVGRVPPTHALMPRRRFLTTAGAVTLALASPPALADAIVELPLPGGPNERPITTGFPDKGALILQRTRPPLLETPFEVFDQSVLTPNDQFYVRWHWSVIPTEIDVGSFRLAVRGHVQPRVPGAQWSNGAMGNARWTGVRLKDLLDRAGVKAGAVQVRFNGLDEPVVDGAPHFKKSLDIEHAGNGEVMLAYQMNGEQLPWLNGFPLRLIVPGWYSTYWVKIPSATEVLDTPDDNYWV